MAPPPSSVSLPSTLDVDEDLDWIDALPAEEREKVERLRKSLNFELDAPSGDDAQNVCLFDGRE